MRRLAASLLLALAVLAPATAARATVLQNLGDFEDGTYGVWQRTLVTQLGYSSDWYVSSSAVTSPVSAHAVYAPSGTYQLVSDASGINTVTLLHRTITIPANADSLKLRFWYRSTGVASMTNITPGSQGQGLRVDLQSTAAGVTTMTGLVAAPFVSGFVDDVAPTTLSFGVQSLRGQTLRLRIAARSNAVPMVAGVDDVRFEGAQFEVIANTGLPDVSDGDADWGDFDGDGDMDLMFSGVGTAGSFCRVYRNDGGTFSLYSSPNVAASMSVKWLDTDHDGDLDAVCAFPAGAAVGTNTGAGFNWVYPYNLFQAGSGLSLCDVDGDGDQDLLGSYGNQLRLLRNNGDGSLTTVSFTLPATLDSSIVRFQTYQDFPSLAVEGKRTDAFLDPSEFQYGSQQQGTVFPASPTFSTSGRFAGAHEWMGSPRDQNDLEFQSGKYGNNTSPDTWIWSGGTAVPNTLPLLYRASVTWGDADDDGDMDVFAIGNAMGTPYAGLQVYGANGQFTAAAESFAGVLQGGCRFGDYDNDGDLDLLVFGQGASGPSTRLYRNNVLTPNVAPAAGVLDPVLNTTRMADGSGLYVLAGTGYAEDHVSAHRTLNVRAGTTPGAIDVISPESDLVTGTRRVAREGNARSRANFPLSRRALKNVHAPIYVSAQMVDGAYKAGPWSNEVQVSQGPRISAVQDVPGDQGGAVRLTLQPAYFDVAGSVDPATSYTVYARVQSPALVQQVAIASRAKASETEDGTLATVALGHRSFVAPAAALASGFPAGTWEVVASFGAIQSSQYVVRVNTVADSGATGPNWSVFVATVHTADPSQWWLSVADSGKSVDNIAPGAPQGVQLSYHPGTHNALSWQPSAAEDFQYFRVYRGTTPSFAISPGTLVGTTADVAWTDPATGTTGVYYKVTALDHAGNESAAATPSVTTDVDGGAAPSYEFALAAPSPSPFAARTAIAFTLPAAQHARLEVFDAAGRRVAKLADGAFAAGPHSVTWDGAADDGTRANAGLLFVRLSAGGREAVRRVVLLGSAK